MKSNIIWHHPTTTEVSRNKQNNHPSAVLWFTGLSGAGKSTLAHAVESQLHALNCRTIVLDGDNVRHGLCADLSFSDKDRRENIRRIAQVNKLFVEAGMIVLNAFVSPIATDRASAKQIINCDNFIEIYCHCNIEVCERRDVKGLYKEARLGNIKNFTGIGASYEAPKKSDLILRTDTDSLNYCVRQVMVRLSTMGVIKTGGTLEKKLR